MNKDLEIGAIRKFSKGYTDRFTVIGVVYKVVDAYYLVYGLDGEKHKVPKNYDIGIARGSKIERAYLENISNTLKRIEDSKAKIESLKAKIDREQQEVERLLGVLKEGLPGVSSMANVSDKLEKFRNQSLQKSELKYKNEFK